jgi:hypothetical protein
MGADAPFYWRQHGRALDASWRNRTGGKRVFAVRSFFILPEFRLRKPASQN